MSLRLLGSVFVLLVCGSTFASADITRPTVKWIVQTGGPIRGAATVTADTVFVGSGDGRLYAIDKTHGDVRWTFDTGGAIAGAPAVTDSLVIVAGRSDAVHALDPADGSLRWQFRMGPLVPADIEWDYFTAAPVVAGRTVLVGSGDGHMYALDLATGAERWRFRTGDRIRATPLVAGGTVYAPSGDDIVHALSLADGTLQWRFETDGVTIERTPSFIRSDIFTRPTLRGDLLAFGSRDSHVYAVDVTTRQERWRFRYDSTWAMSTTADDARVYVGWSTNDMICALDLQTGEKVWEFKAGAHTYTTALVVGEHTYWGSADGHVYDLDRTTGRLNWAWDAGSDIFSSVVHDAGTLYVGADNGKLYALAEGVAPHKAVYQPAVLPANTAALLADPAVVTHFEERGFTRLESTAELESFLTARAGDGAPSVVVFALGHVPAPLLGDDPAAGLLRRYLNAGGRVVWPGGVPNLHAFGEDDTYLGRDPARGEALLGIDFLTLEDSGNYGASPTQAGLDRGLPVRMKTTFASLADEGGVVPLAHDEYGRVGAWLKRFHPRSGSGFVSIRTWGYNTPARPADLDILHALAVYGLE